MSGSFVCCPTQHTIQCRSLPIILQQVLTHDDLVVDGKLDEDLDLERSHDPPNIFREGEDDSRNDEVIEQFD